MAISNSISVALPPIIDLDALDTIRDRLIDAIGLGAVVVDASAVERVSTNALFLLVSAAETAQVQQTGFAIQNVSAAMSVAIERLGLNARFSGMIEQ
ncbi:STAS domain-containing protein [Devosia sp. MC521]|uniref:STAS domain-containing protein n=1 Tax=Devosia sp. MC521 TaxID=2759954 RepID=UPI0015F9C902|nr:STAS domain-containing protein [Devosia sp. MC521]MBJ6987726.1 STAS domain-containing protein [Devosia sp. MC521]QMW62401.1 STAS domain-containing protein [Devosia sp. MC521]